VNFAGLSVKRAPSSQMLKMMLANGSVMTAAAGTRSAARRGERPAGGPCRQRRRADVARAHSHAPASGGMTGDGACNDPGHARAAAVWRGQCRTDTLILSPGGPDGVVSLVMTVHWLDAAA
jgi:hypothetical protein